MICPKCGTEWSCPCSSCIKRAPSTFIQKVENSGEVTQDCINCGFSRPLEWWYLRQGNETYRIYERYLRFKTKGVNKNENINT